MKHLTSFNQFETNLLQESLSNYRNDLLQKHFGLTIEDIKEWFHDFMDEHDKSELVISMPFLLNSFEIASSSL